MLGEIATFHQNSSGDIMVFLVCIPATCLVAVNVLVTANEIFNKPMVFLSTVQHFLSVVIPCGQEYNPQFMQSICFILEMLMRRLPFLKKRDDRQNLWSL